MPDEKGFHLNWPHSWDIKLEWQEESQQFMVGYQNFKTF